MGEKRRLPVLQPSAAPAPEEEASTPPWHWIPLGMVVSLVVGAVFARSFWVPFAQRSVEAVYGAGRSPEEYARIDRTLSAAARDGLQLRLALAGAVVAVLAVVLGGLVVGRFGKQTNERYGALAGLGTTLLLMLFMGRSGGVAGLLGSVLLVPLGGLGGWLGARFGVWLRERG